MRLGNREESENVEDRRGLNQPAGIAIGGGGLLIVVVCLIFGIDPGKVLQLMGNGPAPQGQGPGNVAAGRPDPGQPPRPVDPEEEKQAHFTKVVFGDTERVWDELFADKGERYAKPSLVLYTDQVASACGAASSAVGPFYCPGDSKVYIDLGFYTDMQRKLKAPGEFARAYVVAHEVGHHVQRLLGYSRAVDEARRTKGEVEVNRMSVRLELQADYLAGVWAHHAQKKYNFLDPGDVDAALNAANQIGDDRLQKRSQGYVVPDSFTHGTSQQRQRWFGLGFKTGDVDGARRLFDMNYDEL